MSELNQLISAKGRIKSAIENKGVVVDVGLNEYDEKIQLIRPGKHYYIPDGTCFVYSTFETFEELTQLDISRIRSMHNMFLYCDSLISIPQIDTSMVTDMSGMFNQCKSLTSVPQLDMSKVEDADYMFYLVTTLQNLGGFIGLKVSIDLHRSTLLTHESLMNVINNLEGVNTSPTLTLGETNINKLTDEEIAIATDKGWVVN